MEKNEMDNEQFNIQQSESDGIIIFTVHGDLNAITCEKFDSLINSLVDVGEGIVIDVKDVGYIDNSACRAFSKLSTITKAFGKELKVINTRPEVYKMLDMTGYTEVIDIKEFEE